MKAGVIVVNKPAGFTSFDVVAKCRGILKERHLGHSGTLDPMATGVLPIFIGRATKAIDVLPDSRKCYLARFKLGFSTDTQDSTGEPRQRSDKRAEKAEIEAVLPEFCGKIMQLPPMYSAVKVGGKRLYDLARQGIEVERTPREIEIFRLELTDFDPETGEGGLEIDCSKGTYIRTLINDIGERLGTFGHMTALVRSYSQGFTLAQSVDLSHLEELAQLGRAEELIIPIAKCFDCFPKIRLSERQERLYRNGVRLDSSRVEGAAREGVHRVYGDGFLGLAKVEKGEIRSYKSFWELENE